MSGNIFEIGNLNSAKAGGYGISISIDPAPVILVASFNKLGEDIRSFKEPLKRSIQQVVAPSIRQNFTSSGRPEPWAPLTEKTKKQKRRDGYGRNANKILKRTGTLQRLASTVSIWHIDGINGEAVLTPPGEIFYGAIHQVGFELVNIKEHKNKKTGNVSFDSSIGGLPARPWALIQDEDVPAIEQVFTDWLNERVAANLAAI